MDFCIPEAECISVKSTGTRVTAYAKDKAIELDGESRKLLTGADEIFVVSTFPISIGNVHTAAISIVRKPSKNGRADGACGAGHEDYLALLGVDGDRLNLYDKTLLQSCLKSISLVADEGDDPKLAIKSSATSSSLHYAAIAPPDFELKNFVARVQGGKLLVEAEPTPGM